MPITGDCTSGRKRFLWVVSLKGKQQVSLRFLKKGVAASVSLLHMGGRAGGGKQKQENGPWARGGHENRHRPSAREGVTDVTVV